MRGTKAFPNEFGVDSALMFAGTDGIRSAKTDELAKPTMPPGDNAEPAAPGAEVSARASADAGAYEQPWPTPTIKLGRRGFHFPPRPAQADDVTDETVRQPPGVLLPAILLGVILAASSYFFNFPF